MASSRKWLAAMLAGFVLGVLATSLVDLTGSRIAVAGEPPPAPFGVVSGISWQLENDTWHFGLEASATRYLLIHDPTDEPSAELDPDAPFLLDVTPKSGSVDFHEGRVAIFEMVPAAVCERGGCLPCRDLDLCPFPPEPDEPDGPIKSVWLSDGH